MCQISEKLPVENVLTIVKSCNKCHIPFWGLGNSVTGAIALLLPKGCQVTRFLQCDPLLCQEQMLQFCQETTTILPPSFGASTYLGTFQGGSFHMRWVARDQARSHNVDGCQVVPAREAAHCGRESYPCPWKALRQGGDHCAEHPLVQRLLASVVVLILWLTALTTSGHANSAAHTPPPSSLPGPKPLPCFSPVSVFLPYLRDSLFLLLGKMEKEPFTLLDDCRYFPQRTECHHSKVMSLLSRL